MRSENARAFRLAALLAALANTLTACSTDTHPGSIPTDSKGPHDADEDDSSSDERDGSAMHDSGDLDEDLAFDSGTDLEDGGTPVDEDSGGPGACDVTTAKARCESRSIEMIGASDKRRVYWAKPTKAAPSSGYPAVILYQGSYFGPATTWNVEVDKSTAFGGYHQVRVIAELLELGFVVIQPEAQGGTFWSTNVSGDFPSSSDGVFLPMLLAAMDSGSFEKLDADRLYATGMSSGGYMTSRMAVSFEGRFRALTLATEGRLLGTRSGFASGPCDDKVLLLDDVDRGRRWLRSWRSAG